MDWWSGHDSIISMSFDELYVATFKESLTYIKPTTYNYVTGF